MTDSPAWALVARHEPPRVVAHRGASGTRPENTLASYRRALQLGSDAHETDVFLTRDRRVVAIHDETVDRTTNGSGAVADLTLAEIQQLDAGSWFDPAFASERVPELGELLDVTRGTVLVVEIKDGPGIEEAIRTIVDARQQRPELVLFSFNPDKVALAKLLMPDVPAVFLAWRDDHVYDERTIADARAVHADAIGFDHRRIDADVVKLAHDAGLPVFVWTVNDPAAMRRAASIGVDIVISDVPDVARELFSDP